MTSMDQILGAETEAGAAFAAGRELVRVIETEDPDHHLALVPDDAGGYTFISKDTGAFAAHPRRIVQAHTVRDVASFTAYINRHKTDATEAFAKPSGDIIAIIDSAEASRIGEGQVIEPGVGGWQEHAVTLHREETLGWQAWRKADGVWMTQEAFAEFLLDRIPEITSPAGADLAEIAETFNATSALTFSSKQSLTNGSVQVTYNEIVEGSGAASGRLVLPETIQIAVRPYRDPLVPEEERTDDDPPEDIVALLRLRWRLERSDRSVRFAVTFAEEVYEQMRAIHEAAIGRVEALTGVPVFRIA